MLGAIIKRTVDGSEIPNNHLKCVNLVNNGINYLSLNWCSPDFRTINSIVKSILSNILSGILATVTCEFFSPSFYVAAFPALSDQNSEWKSRVIFFSVLRFFTFKTLQLFLLESIWVFPKVGKHPKMDGLYWKTLLKWMIWGYHYFRKHPFHPLFFFLGKSDVFEILRSRCGGWMRYLFDLDSFSTPSSFWLGTATWKKATKNQQNQRCQGSSISRFFVFFQWKMKWWDSHTVQMAGDQMNAACLWTIEECITYPGEFHTKKNGCNFIFLKKYHPNRIIAFFLSICLD